MWVSALRKARASALPTPIAVHSRSLIGISGSIAFFRLSSFQSLNYSTLPGLQDQAR